MEEKIISMREMQRNYKNILNTAKVLKKPVLLGSHGKVQAVVMDIEDYRRLEAKLRITRQKRGWKEAEAMFDRLAAGGVQNVLLADFVHHDRQAH